MRMVSLNDHSDLTNIWEIFLLMLFQINSIGLRSGEYGGRKTKLIRSDSANARVFCAMWARALSMINRMCFLGFLSRIRRRNAHTYSAVECSINATTSFPFIEAVPQLIINTDT